MRSRTVRDCRRNNRSNHSGTLPVAVGGVMTQMYDPDIQMRRVTVESIIRFAVDSMGNYQLVNVHEGDVNTIVEFDLFHPFRGVDKEAVQRIEISIRTRKEAK